MSTQIKTTSRGFGLIEFKDSYLTKCSVQCSSAIRVEDDNDGFNNPGSSLIWLGVDDTTPQILASQAKKFGITTKETTGWIDYPIPEDVMITGRMHLDRKQVKDLVNILNHWLESGDLNIGGYDD